jgi:hypothetical protein
VNKLLVLLLVFSLVVTGCSSPSTPTAGIATATETLAILPTETAEPTIEVFKIEDVIAYEM